jgi:poly(beta-D-mannuronate) lyase
LKKNTFLYILILLVNVSVVSAANTLVDDKSSFDAAVSSASPGDTIKLKNGTWTNTTLGFYANGTENNPIVVTAQTAGEVILTGTSRLEIYGKYLEVHNLDFKNGALSSGHVVEFRKGSSELAENCRLSNCRILNYNPTSDDTEYKWISLFGKNNRVDHCTFSGKNHEGALLVVWLNGTANYHQIDHNYFSDIPRLDRNGAETIRIGTSTNSMTESRTIVEHNVFEKCDGELEIISNKSGFNIYRYNTFINNDGGLTLRHGNDCEVYGNFFFGASGKSCGGVRIIGERHRVYNNYFQDLEGTSTRAAISAMNGVLNSPLSRYFQVKDAEIVHNTIVSCKQAFAFGVGKNDELSLPPLNCVVANNVVDKMTGNDPIDYIDDPIDLSYHSNFVNFENLSISDPGILNIDPELTKIGNLWRVDQAGPTEGASAVSFNYVTVDMDGQSRGNTPDVGSDEYSQEDVTNSPLSKNDVGTIWSRGNVSVAKALGIEPKVYTFNKILHLSDLLISQGSYTLKLYNTKSQLVFSDKIVESEKSIPFTHLQGFYIVQIERKGNGIYRKKVWF